MPMYNKTEMAQNASLYGFQRDTFEKVLRLINILNYIQEESVLNEHLILKGGTGINLTVFDLPRLSVDIDLDYIPNDSRDDMLANREIITTQLKAYMEGEGYHFSSDSRYHHSLDAFHFKYQNSGGGLDMIKVEINYSLRAHVMEPDFRRIKTAAFGESFLLKTVHPIEMFAAKANALISRAAARDLYDFNNLIGSRLFVEGEDRENFRKTIIFYACISAENINRTFDTSAIDRLTFDRIRRDLFPVLSGKEKIKFDLEGRKTSAKCYLEELMRLTSSEEEFIDHFINGEYKPEFLFKDPYVLDRISNHPMALWKCR